jgi:epoxyqueuosine reductase QueG
MNQEALEFKINSLLVRQGISDMGTATVSPLPQVSESQSPQAFLEEARSVICFGRPIPTGILLAGRDALLLYWRYWNVTYRVLDEIAHRVCFLLEEEGYRSVPAYGCYPMKVQGKEFWGGLPLVYWAEETGVGRLSKCGLLVHPRWGTRISLAGVITTASLRPSGKIKGPVCPSDCTECLTVCPVKAIDPSGRVNHRACMRFANVNPLMEHLLKETGVKEKYSLEILNNLIGVDDHSSYVCFECLKACPINGI